MTHWQVTERLEGKPRRGDQVRTHEASSEGRKEKEKEEQGRRVGAGDLGFRKSCWSISYFDRLLTALQQGHTITITVVSSRRRRRIWVGGGGVCGMPEEGGGADTPSAPAEAEGNGAGGEISRVFREASAVATTSNATTGAHGEDVVQTARSLMRRIVAERDSPNPSLLHSLAAILEQEEARSGFEF